MCVVQNFPYAWPLHVHWESEAGEPVAALAVATESVRPAEGSCSFGTASRLSVPATEWRKGHSYTCHVRQGDEVRISDPLGGSDAKLRGGEGAGSSVLSLPGLQGRLLGGAPFAGWKASSTPPPPPPQICTKGPIILDWSLLHVVWV